MIPIKILQLQPNLNAIATAAPLMSSLPDNDPRNHKQILSYSTNARAAWVTFSPAWSQIPMTNLITHLPNYLVRLSRWGGGGGGRVGVGVIKCAERVSGYQQSALGCIPAWPLPSWLWAMIQVPH